MNKKISIIVPVYNDEKYITRCIDSLINQTYKNFEIIIVDDGSTDKTASICNNYIKKYENIILVRMQHKGQSAARNCGISNCHGDYITFVDSDDYVNNRYLEIMFDVIEKNNCDFCFCDFKIVKDFKYIINESIKENLLSKDDAFMMFFRKSCKKDYYAVWGKLIKKELLNGIVFLENRINEDILFTYELINKANGIVFVDNVLYYYFFNRNGITYKKFNKQKLDLLEIWDIVKNKVEIEHPEYINLCQSNCMRVRFTLLSKMYLNNYNKKDKELNDIHNYLKQYVRKNYKELLKLNMSLSRKILVILLII